MHLPHISHVNPPFPEGGVCGWGPLTAYMSITAYALSRHVINPAANVFWQYFYLSSFLFMNIHHFFALIPSVFIGFSLFE